MTVVTLAKESMAQDGFYVPRFEVRIAGAGLPRDVLRDVLQLTYKDNVKEIDSFELSVSNWDPGTNSFKYIGAETPETLAGRTPQSLRYRLFEPCAKEVEVHLGYSDGLRLMLKGNFTTMEPTFPSGGASTLTVRGLNVLHRLRRKQYTSDWGAEKDKRYAKDSLIAKAIAELKDGGRPRFPLPIEIDREALHDEPVLQYLAQRNQYDIDFLFARARARGYVVFIQEEDPTRGRPERLYFGPSQGRVPGLRDVTFELAWGRSLIDFTPTLTTANQVRSVTVNGWDRKARRPISATVTIDDPKLNRNRDLRELLKTCDPREEIVVDEPVFTADQARKRATAILSDRHKEMVKATGTTIGLPDLRAGQRVLIANVGSRLSGTYFVTETTHTIGEAGYTTRFGARREDDGRGAAR